MMYGGGNRIVCLFIRQYLWKYIGCVLSSVTYGNKVHTLLSQIPKYFSRTASTKLRIDVRGNTNFYKACCDHYDHFISMIAIELFLSYTILFISWMFL